MFKGILKLLLIIMLLNSCLGCSTTLPSKFYLLSSSIESRDQAGLYQDNGGLKIGVGPIKFPEYLKRPQIVTRQSDYELQLAEFHRWGEPLEDNFKRVLSGNLSVLLGGVQVVDYPWKRSDRIDYQIMLTIREFEVSSVDSAVLAASWDVYNTAGNCIVHSEGSIYKRKVEGSGYAGIVAALSGVLNDLSGAIADAVRKEQSCPQSEE
jgi:uncharacterized protein